MKKTLFVFVFVLALLLAGCTQPQPLEPVKSEPKAAAPAKVVDEVITLTSRVPFHTDTRYESGRQESENGPDSEPNVGRTRFEKKLRKSDFKKGQYATLIPGGNTTPATISKFVRIPTTVVDDGANNIDLDSSPNLETLPATGWKVKDNVTVYVFKSEIGSSTSVRVDSEEGKINKTFDELNETKYLWRVVRAGNGTIYATPDKQAMLTNFTPAGIAQFAQYLSAENPFADVIPKITSPENREYSYTPGYQITWVAGQHKYVWQAFSKLPLTMQLGFIDTAGPVMARYAIEKVGPALVRKYLVDLKWEDIAKIDPTKDINNIGGWWPHKDWNAPVAYFGGLSYRQFDDVGPMMSFWARRGQPVFERTKAVFAKELASGRK